MALERGIQHEKKTSPVKDYKFQVSCTGGNCPNTECPLRNITKEDALYRTRPLYKITRGKLYCETLYQWDGQ